MRTLVLLVAAASMAVIVVSTTAVASPANLAATSGIPIKFFGDATIKARAATLAVDGAQGLPNVRVDAQSVHMERVRVTSAYVPVAPGLEATGGRRVETSTFDLPATSLTLATRDPDLLLVIAGRNANLVSHQSLPAGTDQAPPQLWRDAAAQLSALLAPAPYAPPIPSLRVGQSDAVRDDAVTLPAATLAATAQQGRAQLDVDRILFFGGTLRTGQGDLFPSHLARSEQPGNVFANGQWTGPGTHTEETVDYYLIHPRLAHATLSASLLTLFADDAFIEHHGFVGFPWADGRVDTPNGTIQLRGEQAIVGGDLRFRPMTVGIDAVPQITLLGDGDILFVKVGATETDATSLRTAAQAGGAVAAVGLLAVIAYFWPALKYGLSVILFPLYARVPKEETLDHKGRELLYELIRNEPGVSTNRLAKEVPFGWSTLTYHLRVLERNEAIVSVRDGRYKRFFDRTSGRYSNGRKYILAVLKNDASFHIARFIRDRPGSSQKDVATHFQLSPSSIHWHVERLNEVGLVEKAREAHNVKYFPGDAWSHVTVDDLKALADPTPSEPAAAPVGSEQASAAPPA